MHLPKRHVLESPTLLGDGAVVGVISEDEAVTGMGGGPPPAGGESLREGEICRQTHTPCMGEGHVMTDRDDTPRMSGGHWKLGEAWTVFALQPGKEPAAHT